MTWFDTSSAPSNQSWQHQYDHVFFYYVSVAEERIYMSRLCSYNFQFCLMFLCFSGSVMVVFGYLVDMLLTLTIFL